MQTETGPLSVKGPNQRKPGKQKLLRDRVWEASLKTIFWNAKGALGMEMGQSGEKKIISSMF